MRTLFSLLVIALASGCKPSPPPGRPLEVCKDVKATVSCDATPDGPAPEGFSAAANCYVVGNQQFHCGLFDAAAKSLARSAELKPDARTFHALGEADFLQEKWAEAHEAYRHAVDLDGKKRESWVRLAQVYLKLGQLGDAEDAAARAVALDGQKPDALRVDAEALAAEGKYARAVDALRKAEKLGDAASARACTEEEANVLDLQLRKLQRDHATEEAIGEVQGELADALDRQVKLSSTADAKTQEALYRALADARLGSGSFDDAEVALRKTASLNPKDFVSPRLVGLILEKKGDATGARAALQQSLQVEPKQAMPFIVLGRLDAAAGDLVAARKDFVSALANEDGKDATETRQLAALAMKVGAADKAEALYLSLDPDPDVSAQVGFWLDRASASAALGHAAEVTKACTRARAIVETIACPPKPDAVSPRP